jgi:hypothetical protein
MRIRALGLALLSLAVSTPLLAQTLAQQQPLGVPPTTERGDAARDASKPAPAPAQGAFEGRGLGEHVSGVAPEHPVLHGADFGACVSEMALTGACPMEMEGH